MKTGFIMEILLTNDDGYKAKGIKVLAGIMEQFGNVTAIAPKRHQSGMSMAASLGLKQLAYRKLSREEADRDTYRLTGPEAESAMAGRAAGGGECGSVSWAYLDATPASCVKFGLNTCFLDRFPDVVVSGINHGSNASSASCYSGTLGAAAEAALNGIPAIGVSLATINPAADFSGVIRYFPDIFRMIMSSLPERKGIYYNVNFPDIPADGIKGVRVGNQGIGRWVREFEPWNPSMYGRHGITPEMLGQSSIPAKEDGEELYMMVGDYLDDPQANTPRSDHWLMRDGYISIVAHNIDTTDRQETARMESLGFDRDF